MLEKYWELIGTEIIEMVKNVEKKPLTTKNHYGNYMHLLSVLIDGGINIKIARALLIKADGNVDGINDAYKCIHYDEY